MLEIKSERLNATEFIENLLKEGELISCDESIKSFIHNDVPSFYNKETYERGRRFFYRNIHSVFFSKILGLLTVLAIPSIVKILINTKMSSTPMTAYKRYLATVFHMCIWYKSDFKPGSQIWKSLNNIKSRHNSASKKSYSAGMNRITQKDMALTQFGFMGYAVIKSEMVGIHGESDEDLYAFTHIWRVVGHIMGIQERFNICRESIEETREICRLLIERVFRPEVRKKNKDFVEMATYLINGMWSMNPFLQPKVLLVYVSNLLKDNMNNNHPDNENDQFIKLNQQEVGLLNLITGGMYYVKYSILRIFLNIVMHISLWLMKVFPFLAYYQFGYKNSYVNIYS